MEKDPGWSSLPYLPDVSGSGCGIFFGGEANPVKGIPGTLRSPAGQKCFYPL